MDPGIVRKDHSVPSYASRKHKRSAVRGAFIDAEHALDIGYARKIGVDVNNLLVSQPENGEQALEIQRDAGTQ